MLLFIKWRQKAVGIAGWTALLGSLLVVAGCGSSHQADAESQGGGGPQDSATVNVAVASQGTARQEREYVGTTQPFRLVSLRSQVEGQLIALNVTVGDSIRQGQPLAQLDSRVLQTNVAEAEAEVAARESEVAQAQIEVSDAQTQVSGAQAELQQAQADLKRLQYLSRQGAIPKQQAEQARTRVRTAAATLRSAQEQVRTRRQGITAVQQRVTAQQAVVAREQQLQAYAVLTSPVTGSVVEQPMEPGNLVQPGTEVLKLGDFSQVKVAVQLSELELDNIRLRQLVQVKLDAFPQQSFTGRVSRISPAADPVARLVPIEIIIPNPGRRIGSGLLARVNFAQRTGQSRVLVPETALQTGEARAQGGQNRSNSQPEDRSARQAGTLFIIEESGKTANVSARPVTLGGRADGQVEVLSGLRAGERFVARSSKALKNGDEVKLSILSE
jgi:HlyD family secretion protein